MPYPLDELLAAGFERRTTGNGAAYFALELADHVEVCLEPLILERGQFALGVYRDRVLVSDGKLVVDLKGLRA